MLPGMDMNLTLPTDKVQRLEALAEACQELTDMLHALEAVGVSHLRLSLEAWADTPTPVNGASTS